MDSSKFFFFLIYLMFGLYLIDFSLQYYSIPNFLMGLNKWILLIAGILLLFSAIGHLLSKGNMPRYPR